MRFSEGSLVLPFVAGTALTLVIQSSSTMSAIAVTMTSAGILSLDQTLMIVMGSNLGSGFGTFLLASNLSGTGRQLALIQLWVKAIGVVLILPWLLLEIYGELPSIKAYSAQLSADLPHRVALVYLLLQLVSAAMVSATGATFGKLARRLCPPKPTEALSKPVYLYEQAIEEAETALDLVEKEQSRLIGLLPRLLDELRPDEIEGEPFQGRDLYEACASVARQCEVFIDRLMGHPQSHQTLERLMNVRSRNELLNHLQDGCRNLQELLGSDFSESVAISLRHSLVEGLCTVLMVLEDAVQEGATTDHRLLMTLTSDRSSIMKNLRESMIKAENGLGIESQSKLLPATSLFERLIWLINRYGVLLNDQIQAIPEQEAYLAEAQA
jgi:phosphate:Na+ symporter